MEWRSDAGGADRLWAHLIRLYLLMPKDKRVKFSSKLERASEEKIKNKENRVNISKAAM